MLSYLNVLLLVSSASALSPILRARQSNVTGLATFNDFAAQGHTVCGLTAPNNVYIAAVSDIASFITGITCGNGNGNTGNDMSKCKPSGDPIDGYQGPSCTGTPCGVCYKVTPKGGYNGASVPGPGAPVTVMISDICPAEHAQNYCKALKPPPANDPKQICESQGENALDIDVGAYSTLTGGLQPGSGPNMNIAIGGPVPCTPS